MALKTYYEKRDFEKTPEPRGKPRETRGSSYVIQKHAATRLHYDLRLEMNGVMKSWAVPKGPSYDPREKRLAVHVEDHPVEYRDFEGVIPKGEYGGGTVMVWDRGDWVSLDEDPEASYAKGIMKFRLEGEKLQGAWTLIRMKTRDGEEGKENWLFIKERDEYVRTTTEFDVTEALPDSVVTGRSIKEIAEDRDDVWHSKALEDFTEQAKSLPGAKKASFPDFIEPQLATLYETAPAGDEWIHEIKLDGYRELCRIDGREIRLISRNGKDWTDQFRSLIGDLRSIPARKAMLDGEVVALLPNGVSSFQALQNVLSESEKSRITYYAFDLLYLEGYDLRNVPLRERKALLAELLRTLPPGGSVRYSDHFAGDGAAFQSQACGHGLEGIVSKRADGRYRSGRGRDWQKIKCLKRQEFVVVGFTEPSGGRKGLGALLLGLYEKKGELTFAGRVGTGFTEKTLRDLRKRLEALEQDDSPLRDAPRGAAARGVHWVKPELVAEVAFTEWTQDGQLRHPSFMGLREDKRPAEVVREKEQDAKPPRTGKSAKSAKPGEGRAKPKTGARDPKSEAMPPSKPAKAGKETAEIAGVRLSNPAKLLYPESGITKRDLAEYYEKISDWMLPYVQNRLLTLIRCPNGWNAPCFFQKHIDEDPPPHIKRVPIVEEKGEETYYFAITSTSGLVSLVQLGALEIHPWGSTADKPDKPDTMIFDLDPEPSVKWDRVAGTAFAIRDVLDALGLKSFLKTTGGKGLHVVVPLIRRHSWDEVKEFSRAVVQQFVHAEPSHYTMKVAKSARTGKILLDYLRNAEGSHAVAAYSARAKAGATVSVPIFWEELEEGIRSDSLTLRDVPKRLESLSEDPWAGYFDLKQFITKKMKEQVGL